jgi:hypothetical protein
MAARLAALQADNRALVFDAASLSDRIEALNVRIAACHMHSSPSPVKGASGRRRGVGPTALSDTIPSSAPSAPSASTPPLGGGPLPAVQPAVGTDRLYFQDTYRFTADATVVSHFKADDKCVLVLNKTVGDETDSASRDGLTSKHTDCILQSQCLLILSQESERLDSVA